MKKLLKLALAFTACAAALCLTAAAVEPLSPVKVWGTVSPWDGEGVFLKNSDTSTSLNEVVVHLGDAPVVDAVTGLPMEKDSIKEGDTLYVWVGPAMTLSLPPQASAIVAVGNVPADAAAPEYYQVSNTAVKPIAEKEIRVPVLGGETLIVPEDVKINPWLTRQIVTVDDLVPGAQILVWKDAEGKAEQILVFAYAYEGYLNMTTASRGEPLACVNGAFDENTPQFQCKGTDNVIMVPVRAVAEAAGYDVRWDKELGAVVSQNGETVLSAKPGAEVIQTPNGEAGISAPCMIEKGVTYLPAEDFAHWLNLFLVK